jgi:hypothetical protein
MANSVNCSEMRISDFETVESCCVNRLINIDPPCNRVWVGQKRISLNHRQMELLRHLTGFGEIYKHF